MSIAARSRGPIRRRASAIAPANAVYQVNVPKPTPTSSATVPAEDRAPPETAAGGSRPECDRERVEGGRSESGRERPLRHSDFLLGLEPETRPEADPHRPQAQRPKYRRPDEAERKSYTVGCLESPSDAREPKRRVAEVDERDRRPHGETDPEVAAHGRAHDQQRDRPDLGGYEQAEAVADQQ